MSPLMSVACEVGVPSRTWDLHELFSSCFHLVLVPQAQLTSVLAPLPQSRKGTFYLSLMRAVVFPQNVFSPICRHSSNELVLWGTLLGKSADDTSMLWVSLLLL